MVWQAYAIIWFATLILGELLAPKPKSTVRPASLGDFQFPTAQEGRPVPVCWGRNEVRGANLVWYGDYSVNAIKEKVKSGIFSSTKVTVGYKYSVGMQFVLCIGQATALKKIKFGEKTVWEGSAMNSVVYANAPAAFGGEDSEGGVQGYFAIQDGNAGQAIDPYLESQFGVGNSPAYRGATQVVFYGPSGATLGGGAATGYVGTTPYIKAPSFQIERFPANLGGGYENVNGDANPIECLFEILNSRIFGCGIPLLRIDSAAFQAAAATCHAEGNGFSMLWDRKSKGSDIAKTILDQVDGVLYTDPATGKLTIRLARADYVLGNLPIFDPSNVLELENFSRGGFSGATSEVSVAYEDAANDYKTRSITAHNAAVWEVEESVQPYAVDFPGVRTAQLAADLATRELRALSYTPAKLTIITDRDAHNAYPGMPFRFQWPDEIGVEDVVMRVTNVGLGDALDGRIKIDAIQDIFAVASATFTLPAPSGWVPPINTPAPIADQLALESFYWANLTSEQADPEAPKAMYIAMKPTPDTLRYTLQSKTTTETDYITGQQVVDFGANGKLTADLLHDAADGTGSIIVQAIAGMELLTNATWSEINQGKNLFMLDDEIIGFETITNNLDGTYTLGKLWRGLLDTTPQDHKLPAAHTHYRVNITANHGHFYLLVGEMDYTDENQVNLTDALGGTTFYDGYDELNYPSKAFDGNQSTAWGRRDTGGKGQIGWIFPSPTVVNYTWLKPRTGSSVTAYDQSPKDFTLDVSDDGVTWETVGRYVDQNHWTLNGGADDYRFYPMGSNGLVYFLDQGADIIDRAFTVGAVVQIRAVTQTPAGSLDETAATVTTASMEGRAAKPYPPGNFTVNGTRYLGLVASTGDITIGWRHRDRTTELATITKDSAAVDYGPEAGLTYNLRLKDPLLDDIQLYEYTGLTGTSQVVAELALFPEFLRVPLGTGADFNETTLTLHANGDQGSYVSEVTDTMFLDPGSGSATGSNYEHPNIAVTAAPIVMLGFNRLQAGTWYDDDFSDSGFILYIMNNPVENGLPVYITGAWKYEQPQGAGPYIAVHFRRTIDKPVYLSGTSITGQNLVQAVDRVPGEFDGTAWIEVAIYNVNGFVGVAYAVDGVIKGQVTTGQAWATSAFMPIWHLHTYGSSGTETITNMKLSQDTSGFLRKRELKFELDAEVGGVASKTMHIHTVKRHVTIAAQSAQITIAAQNATILKQPDIFAGSGALVIASGNATITKTHSVTAGAGAITVAAANASISKI